MNLSFRSIFCAVLFCVACSSARAEWTNTLKPLGRPAGHVKIVKRGQLQGGIQLPAQPTPQETNAAVELQHWVKEMTGATLPINAGSSRHAVLLIRTDASLGDEGYAIAIEHGKVVLSGGKTRGVVNAVYALLEEDLGCRFYADDSIRLPQTNTLVLAPVARRFIPQLKIRDPYYACAFDPVWSVRNRANSPSAAVPEEQGGHMDYAGMFVHTAAQMVPPDQYFKDHPEYFAQQADGTRTTAQLCATEPEVARIVIAYVRKMLQDHPHTKIVSVSKNDVVLSCLCPRCTALRTAEGSDMANQLTLVNRVAEAIEAEHPDVLIDTLAYLETIQVPKTMWPRRNVAIRLCNDSVGAWSYPFQRADQCDVAKLVQAWSAVCHRIYIWDYNVNFSHYLAPMPNLDIMAANIRFWTTNHAEGVMLQGGYQGPAEQDQLKSWVTAKLLWNPSWDENALTRDFIEGHYRAAASALLEYDRLLRRLRVEHATEMAAPPGGIRYPMDAPFFTKAFMSEAAAIFARARQLAGTDEVLLRRVDRAELPLLYVNCVRGPDFAGPEYAAIIQRFEQIARREKIQYLQEGGPDFEDKLAGYKALAAGKVR